MKPIYLPVFWLFELVIGMASLALSALHGLNIIVAEYVYLAPQGWTFEGVAVHVTGPAWAIFWNVMGLDFIVTFILLNLVIIIWSRE